MNFSKIKCKTVCLGYVIHISILFTSRLLVTLETSVLYFMHCIKHVQIASVRPNKLLRYVKSNSEMTYDFLLIYEN